MTIGSSVIERTPRLAELVGRIAINWAGVEVQLSLALGSMLGVENAAGIAVFLSLRNHRAQRDALRAAAEKSLQQSEVELFEAILARHEELDSQRNATVHCIWGISEATPDGIIWSSQQSHANMLITDYHMEKTGQLNHETRVANMTKDLHVVRFSDLEALNADIMKLDRSVGNFHAFLRYRESPAGKNAHQALLDDAVVQQKLKALRSRGSSGG